MSRFKRFFDPRAYLRALEKPLKQRCERYLSRQREIHPNLMGAHLFPPGHYASPLLDIESIAADDLHMRFDGAEDWDCIELRESAQRGYYQHLLDRVPILPFPVYQTAGYRYFSRNDWFDSFDAFTLSGLLQKERPRRVVEVGSGFSSAVMLDTREKAGMPALLTFIEPFPERLHGLLTEKDVLSCDIVERPVQEVPLSIFAALEAQDILFIDSSHVAKIGSDVSFLLLRILPRLKPGVFVHFHDIFYPYSYPISWIREGRAWNESLFIRAFLLRNSDFEIVAFNPFAANKFPEFFRDRLAGFSEKSGASLWLRKIA